MPLTFASQPGFFDIGSAVQAAHQYVADELLLKINHISKLGALRPEFIFMGFYKDGDTVTPPQSPADAYTYDPSEVQYIAELASTRAPGAGFVSGQSNVPAISGSQPANLYYFFFDVPDVFSAATPSDVGKVKTLVSYYKPGGQETVTNDGMVKVYALCQRGQGRLTLAAQPSFTDLSDGLLQPNLPVTDTVIQAMVANAKLAAVRCESIYMGYYENGNTVGVPTSPADGYTYLQSEVLYIASLRSTRAAAPGFIPGQAAPPLLAAGQAGSPIVFASDVDDSTGLVTSAVFYDKGGSNDGLMKVYALCQRQSVNVAD